MGKREEDQKNRNARALIEAIKKVSPDLDEVKRLCKLFPKKIDLNYVDTQNNRYTFVHYAAERGHQEVINIILNQGVLLSRQNPGLKHNVNAIARDKNSRTPLHIAAANGHADAVATLLAHGVDVESGAGDNSKRSPLHLAAENGHKEIVEVLLAGGAKINAQDASKSTPLHLASKSGHAEVVEMFLKKKDGGNANVRLKDKSGNTPLHLAVENRHEGVIKKFLDCNTALDMWNALKLTPAEFAEKLGFEDIIKILSDYDNARKEQEETNSANLLKSVASRDIFAVTTLLQQKIDVNFRYGDGDTALHVASFRGFGEIVKILLDCGADPNIKDEKGYTALHHAASESDGYGEIVKILLDCGADQSLKDKKGYNPLHHASLSGFSEIVAILLNYGADVEAKIQDKRTALHLASSCRFDEIVKILLSHKADVNAQDKDGFTPLHAIMFSEERANSIKAETQTNIEEIEIRIVKMLLDHGADKDAKNRSKFTPLHLASSHKSGKIAEILLAHGANKNAMDEKGAAPLHVAVLSGKKHGSIETVAVLLAHEADKDIKNIRGSSPLHTAALYSNIEAAKLLLEAGANANIKDNQEDTPLHFASLSGFIEIVKLLSEYGANLNAKNKAGDTPLNVSLSQFAKCDAKVVEVLLANGADFDAKCQKLISHSGANTKNKELFKVLSDAGVLNLPLEAGAAGGESVVDLSGAGSTSVLTPSLEELRHGTQNHLGLDNMVSATKKYVTEFENVVLELDLHENDPSSSLIKALILSTKENISLFEDYVAVLSVPVAPGGTSDAKSKFFDSLHKLRSHTQSYLPLLNECTRLLEGEYGIKDVLLPFKEYVKIIKDITLDNSNTVSLSGSSDAGVLNQSEVGAAGGEFVVGSRGADSASVLPSSLKEFRRLVQNDRGSYDMISTIKRCGVLNYPGHATVISKIKKYIEEFDNIVSKPNLNENNSSSSLIKELVLSARENVSLFEQYIAAIAITELDDASAAENLFSSLQSLKSHTQNYQSLLNKCAGLLKIECKGQDLLRSFREYVVALNHVISTGCQALSLLAFGSGSVVVLPLLFEKLRCGTPSYSELVIMISRIKEYISNVDNIILEMNINETNTVRYSCPLLEELVLKTRGNISLFEDYLAISAAVSCGESDDAERQFSLLQELRSHTLNYQLLLSRCDTEFEIKGGIKHLLLLPKKYIVALDCAISKSTADNRVFSFALSNSGVLNQLLEACTISRESLVDLRGAGSASVINSSLEEFKRCMLNDILSFRSDSSVNLSENSTAESSPAVSAEFEKPKCAMQDDLLQFQKNVVPAIDRPSESSAAAILSGTLDNVDLTSVGADSQSHSPGAA